MTELFFFNMSIQNSFTNLRKSIPVSSPQEAPHHVRRCRQGLNTPTRLAQRTTGPWGASGKSWS